MTNCEGQVGFSTDSLGGIVGNDLPFVFTDSITEQLILFNYIGLILTRYAVIQCGVHINILAHGQI